MSVSLYYTARSWLNCLEEAAGVLADVQWSVHLDDMEFKWSGEKHGFYRTCKYRNRRR